MRFINASFNLGFWHTARLACTATGGHTSGASAAVVGEVGEKLGHGVVRAE